MISKYVYHGPIGWSLQVQPTSKDATWKQHLVARMPVGELGTSNGTQKFIENAFCAMLHDQLIGQCWWNNFCKRQTASNSGQAWRSVLENGFRGLRCSHIFFFEPMKAQRRSWWVWRCVITSAGVERLRFGVDFMFHPVFQFDEHVWSWRNIMRWFNLIRIHWSHRLNGWSMPGFCYEEAMELFPSCLPWPSTAVLAQDGCLPLWEFACTWRLMESYVKNETLWNVRMFLSSVIAQVQWTWVIYRFELI